MNENKKLEKHIDEDSNNYTDWTYIEGILEWLDDYSCLTKKGKKFWNYIWKKHIKEAIKCQN